MPYNPRREIKENRNRINWWIVIIAAVITFAGSILLGKWVGNRLLASRAGVPEPTAQQIYNAPIPAIPSERPVMPQSPSVVERQDVSPSPLQIPPPVVETPPPVETSPSETNEEENNAETKPEIKPEISPSPAEKENPAPKKSEKTASSAKGTFRVQVGFFADQDRATELQHELDQDGYNSFVAPMQKENATYYQVLLGPYENQDEANSIAAELNNLGYQAFVTSTMPEEKSKPSPSPRMSPSNPQPSSMPKNSSPAKNSGKEP